MPIVSLCPLAGHPVFKFCIDTEPSHLSGYSRRLRKESQTNIVKDEPSFGFPGKKPSVRADRLKNVRASRSFFERSMTSFPIPTNLRKTKVVTLVIVNHFSSSHAVSAPVASAFPS